MLLATKNLLSFSKTYSRYAAKSLFSTHKVVCVESLSPESRFLVSSSIREHEIWVDLMQHEHGADKGPSPREYLLVALGSCTAMTVRTFFENTKRASSAAWEDASLKNVSVQVEEIMNKHAHIPAEIIIRLKFEGQLNQNQINRLEKAALHCPVKKILLGGIYQGYENRLKMTTMVSDF